MQFCTEGVGNPQDNKTQVGLWVLSGRGKWANWWAWQKRLFQPNHVVTALPNPKIKTGGSRQVKNMIPDPMDSDAAWLLSTNGQVSRDMLLLFSWSFTAGAFCTNYLVEENRIPSLLPSCYLCCNLKFKICLSLR